MNDLHAVKYSYSSSVGQLTDSNCIGSVLITTKEHQFYDNGNTYFSF